jgi:hypothetical protein
MTHPHLAPPPGTHHYGTAWLGEREVARHARAEARSYAGPMATILAAIATRQAEAAEARMGHLAAAMQAIADEAVAPVCWPIGGGVGLTVWPTC